MFWFISFFFKKFCNMYMCVYFLIKNCFVYMYLFKKYVGIICIYSGEPTF